MTERVRVMGGAHVSLAVALATRGVPVDLVEADPHDRTRLRDGLSRLAPLVRNRLCLCAEAQGTADLILGDGTAQAVILNLDWRASGSLPRICVSHRPNARLLVEVLGADTGGDGARLAALLGGTALHLPEADMPLSVCLDAAQSLALERLLLTDGTPEEIDAALTCAGWTIGAFELQDLRGVDTALRARGDVLASRGEPTDLPLFARAVAEGRLGCKVGVGWYRYPGGDGKVEDPLVEDMAVEEAHFFKWRRYPVSPAARAEAVTNGLAQEAARCLAQGGGPQDLRCVLEMALGLDATAAAHVLSRAACRTGAFEPPSATGQ